MSNKTKIYVALAIIALAAASRLVNHPANVTPVAALALFGGCCLKNKWGLILPLAAMFISDCFIGFYAWPVMLAVYGSFALVFIFGRVLSARFKWYNVIFSSLAGSVVFFLLTNLAVWAFASWYPHTWSGLISCFTLALPFFRNTLAGDLIYAGAFFGAYALALRLAAKRILVRQNI